MLENKKEKGYNNAKIWQMFLFSWNTAAVNIYLALMAYTSYYANQVAGFGVVLISVILTSLKVFDGITDPLVGYFLDKTQGRFGKFRPFMLLGNIMMAGSAILLFYTTHYVNKELRILYFVAVYMIYVIGFTFQSVVGKSGQTIMTNNPSKRPLSTLFDSVCIMAAYGGTALYVSNYLIPKYGDYDNSQLYRTFTVTAVIVSLVCTIGAIIGISEKDKPQYFKNEQKTGKVRIIDYYHIIKGNKPIRMLVLAASTDKFAATVYGDATVIVMMYGILMGNYQVAGLIGIVTAIPSLFVVMAGIKLAQKAGQKRTLVVFTWLCILFQIMITGVLVSDNVNTISFTKINTITIIFVILYILSNGCKSVSNNLVVPMIADCSDYEVYRSGKYVPGLMGALFSFVDKVISAFGTAFVGLIIAAAGYSKNLPTVTDPLTIKIKYLTVFFYSVVPIAGWIISIYAMRHYNLDRKKMQEINEINR